MSDQHPLENESNSDKVVGGRPLLLLLRLGAFLCFSGWAWVHLYWEGPYGPLLWHETTFELADSLGVTWDEFVGTGYNDGLVQRWVAKIGWLYVVCAALTLTSRRDTPIQLAILTVLGCGLLSLLAYAKYLGAQCQLPMLVEHGGQVLMPAILTLALYFGISHRATVSTAVVATILTFAGHGSYAMGLWPTPPTFFAMTSVILGVEYEAAKQMLYAAGLLDLLVCVGILIPVFRRFCAAYAAIWGALTALARPVAGMSWELNYWAADQFLPETLLRAPHAVIPLYLLVVWTIANRPSVS